MQSICNKPILLTQKIGDSTARIAGKSSRTTATYHLKKPIKQVKTEECFLSQKLGGGAGIGHPHREFLRATESVGARIVKNVLFVDARVENCDSLARGATADTEVFVLDSTRDGVEQITRILANCSDLDSLQIVSHGREARVQLGSIELCSDNLETYSHLLQQWGKALSERGDILLCGCSVAAGESGAAFVRRLSLIAGADIAASDNLTGSAALGGDWELKFATGEIKASIAIEKEVLEAYTYALGTKETFKNSTVRGPGIYGGNDGALLNPSNGVPPANQRIPGITGGTVSGRIPALGGSSPGDGALRSTKAADDPEAFVMYNNPITSTDGLRVRFDFYSDGSSEQDNAQGPSISAQPGDSLGFFLIDGTASPERTEGYGGSLAYAPRTGIPGMEGGDLGLELDEFGNFSTSTEGPGGQEPPRIPGSSIGSFKPDSVIAPATRSGISNTARSSEATFDRLATNTNGSPTNQDGTPTNSTVTTSIPPKADLATTKTGSTSATPGSSVSYTIATANLCPSPAEAATITESIVPGLTGVTASNGGVYEPATGIVPEGPVAIAKAQTLTRTRGFTVPPTLTSIRNTARSTSIAPDSTPANNNGTNPNATVTTSIDAVADVVTQKTAPASINGGRRLLYTITTSNNGPSPAANAVIIDSLIPGLTNVTVSDGGTYNSATGAIDFPAIATLASGTNQSRTISFVPPPTLTSITNIVLSRSDTPDPDLTNNNGSIVAGPGQAGGRVTTSIDAAGADLVTSPIGLTSAPAGSSVTHTITTANNGPNAAENVVIADSIIPGLTGVRASNNGTYDPVTAVVTFPTIPSLTSGSNTNRHVKLVVPATGIISHTSGSRSTTFDPEPSNNNGSEPRATVTTAISAQSTPNLLPISQQQQRCASTQQPCQNQQARRQRLRQHSSYRNNGSKALPF